MPAKNVQSQDNKRIDLIVPSTVSYGAMLLEQYCSCGAQVAQW